MTPLSIAFSIISIIFLGIALFVSLRGPYTHAYYKYESGLTLQEWYNKEVEKEEKHNKNLHKWILITLSSSVICTLISGITA